MAVARALAMEPKIILADEPVSALDKSVQAQVLNLFHDLQKEFGISIIFISHDLSVVEYMSDHIAVLYLGEVIEYSTSEELYHNPRHPYTKELLRSIPQISGDARLSTANREPPIELPSPIRPAPPGCPVSPPLPVPDGELLQAYSGACLGGTGPHREVSPLRRTESTD